MTLLRFSRHRGSSRHLPLGFFAIVLALLALYVGLVVFGLLAIGPVSAVLHGSNGGANAMG